MKKLFLLTFLLPCILVSCSDDNNNDYSSSDIIGTWHFSSSAAKEVRTNKTELIKTINKDAEQEYKSSNYTITFTTGGEITFAEGENTVTGTYTLKGNKLSYNIGGNLFDSEITVSENKLLLLEDVTDYYKNREVITKLLGAETAEGAEVYKVTVIETYSKH